MARLFSLDIVSASLASIDVNSTHIDLIVAASDDPHGVIQFSVGALSVVEGEASVPVTVVRGDGLVGDVRVNFDLQLGSADQNDFNISSQCESMIFLRVICTTSIDEGYYLLFLPGSYNLLPYSKQMLATILCVCTHTPVLLLTFHSTMIKYPDSVVFEDKRKEYH